jgi:hypothetical protein
MFLVHVIGGKRLSTRAGFTRMVQAATPDVVLAAAEIAAHRQADPRIRAGGSGRVGP